MVVLAFAGIQLIPDGTLFIHIALILLMIWILNRTLFRPINKVLAARDKQGGGRNSEALEILNKVRDKNNAFEAAIRDARDEGYKLVEKQRTKAIATRQKNIETVKEEIATLLVTEKDSITEQTTKARSEIASEAKKRAEQISANLLKA